MNQMHRTIKIAALAATALAATALTATAGNAYSADAAGAGFVGKGEVQSAFNMKNETMQKAVEAKAFSFTGSQATSQALSQGVVQYGTQSGSQTQAQIGTQSATQVGTQLVSQDLTCTFTNGNGTKTFHREGIRDGERDGSRTTSREASRTASRDASRDGERTGERIGIRTGSIASDVAYVNKRTGQYTGFFLTGLTNVRDGGGSTSWGEPTYGGTWTPSGSGSWSFGEWSEFGNWSTHEDFVFGDYTWEPVTAMGATEWGEWDAAPGENPDDCLRSANADKITQISNVVTLGASSDGDVTQGTLVPGATITNSVVEGDYAAKTGEGSIRSIEPATTVGSVTYGPLQVSVTYTDPRTTAASTKALTPTA